MAEFLGIRNENEFYFAHYLSSLMDDELKEQCQNEVLATARDKILKLGNDYYEVRHLRERVEQHKGTFTTDVKEYLVARHAFVEKFANVLGYAGDYKPDYVAFKGDKVNLPISGCVYDVSGAAKVVLIDSCRSFAVGGRKVEASILQNPPTSEQLKCDGLTPADIDSLSMMSVKAIASGASRSKSQLPYWDNLLTNELFASQNHPRFVIVFGENAILLADYTKWAERRSLVFLLDDIFEQTDRATCRAMACLLHRNSLVPSGGTEPLPDKLDANSHKNAFGVSQSLRYAMRSAIEDLGNAIIANKPEGVEIEAAALSKECILVMYRFLFVLFLESRKDLKYFKRSEGNAANDIFWSAYGIDHLRDLETVPLLTSAAKNGHYFDESIKQLFSKMWEGANVDDKTVNPAASVEGFRLLPLKAHLFDPDRTPLFNQSRIPNVVWQKIVYSLSIGETGTGKRKRKGRISYAQLGIQQLGAVYEALLSYTGFYAKEDLYEVCNAGVKGGEAADDSDDSEDSEAKGGKLKDSDIFETGYFVTDVDLKNYTEAEIVSVDGHRVCHKKGSFIYRMAGRDRERSASYYTPPELTQCLVRQAIAERIKPEMKAKDIMKLTVCEPAMGSAAFLNEMIDQLAEIYLARAEKERGEVIPLEQRAAKKARVKMVIADQNVFGVDLNPMAADLAEVSLWLGTIGGETEPTGQDRDSVYIPWFGNQLVCGNSIIGARREVVLADGSHKRVGFETDSLPRGGIWHFLLPDDGMALTLDPVVRGLCPEEDKKIKAWKKSFKLFDKKSKSEKEREKYEKQHAKLLDLSKAINELWIECAKEAKDVDEKTFDDVDYYGHKSTQKAYTDISSKDILLDQIEQASKLENASTTFRMKMLLDMWCSLWFWPIEKVDELPSYEDFIAAAEILAKKDFSAGGQMHFDFWSSDVKLSSRRDELVRAFAKDPSFENLYALFPFTKTAREIAARQRFLHWELVFVNVFYQRGGFDFVIGNPPWVKVEWKEKGILSEYNPYIAIRGVSASDTSVFRDEIFEKYQNSRSAYIQEFYETTGTKSFLTAGCNYPWLLGVQSNLFKYFVPLSYRLISDAGIIGYVHPEGIYRDPECGKLRREVYHRLRLHANFRNELKLFDIGNTKTYSLNIYGSRKDEIWFRNVSKLFHPSTLEECLRLTDETAEIPLERTKDDHWDLRGHPSRVVEITKDTLALFATLYDESGTPLEEARLPSLYIRQFFSPILNVLGGYHMKQCDMDYMPWAGWNEAGAQRAGIIKRKTVYPLIPEEVVFSSAMIQIGNPFSQTPRQGCRNHRDYEGIDLLELSETGYPRVNFVYEMSRKEASLREKEYKGDCISNAARIFCRCMVDPKGTRTLTPCLAARGYMHIDAMIQFAFPDVTTAANVCGSWCSLPYDWFVRTLEKGNFRNEIASVLPVVPDSHMLRSRTLLLNCVHKDYASIWHEAWDAAYSTDNWLSNDERLTKWDRHLATGDQWSWNVPFRTDLDRRQALIELDVITTKLLGLDVEDLIQMYHVSFPTLNKYDADTYYDQNGRCVFTGQPCASYMSRKEWDSIKDMDSGEHAIEIVDRIFSDDPVKRTITYKAPFFKKNREDDYREAWAKLEERESKKA